MKQLFKRAFTLAELMIAFMIIAIVATITVQGIRLRDNIITRYLSYSAIKNLQLLVGEVLADGFNGDKLLPDFGYVGDGTGFCEKISNKVNTIGTTDCNNVLRESVFTPANANFITANGFVFFNFGVAPTPLVTTESDRYFTVNIDIDGKRGSSVDNEDVQEFRIYRDGRLLPISTSKMATDKNYLTASVKYKDGSGNTNWLSKSVSYKEALCVSGYIDPAIVGCGGIAKNALCDTNTCEVVINKP